MRAAFAVLRPREEVRTAANLMPEKACVLETCDRVSNSASRRHCVGCRCVDGLDDKGRRGTDRGSHQPYDCKSCLPRCLWHSSPVRSRACKEFDARCTPNPRSVEAGSTARQKRSTILRASRLDKVGPVGYSLMYPRMYPNQRFGRRRVNGLRASLAEVPTLSAICAKPHLHASWSLAPPRSASFARACLRCSSASVASRWRFHMDA